MRGAEPRSTARERRTRAGQGPLCPRARGGAAAGHDPRARGGKTTGTGAPRAAAAPAPGPRVVVFGEQ